MSENMIKDIVIVGGGTAGWMTASALVKQLGTEQCTIRLVESDQIATVGVGEATIPPIREFNRRLEIDEPEFMRATNASIKLGIQFENWRKLGDSYIHPFGSFGTPIHGVRFHHHWLKQKHNGDAGSFFDYNLPHVAAENNKFSLENSTMGELNLNYFYAFHFDAGLYAQYLRGWSEQRGVTRTEGKVEQVQQCPETGNIESITLESGETIHGDLFIDCTGFRGLLIEQTLETGYDNWSHWLPVNRAWATTTSYLEGARIPPYTRARALEAGWQWRIPLQNRTGDGHVFSSEFMDEDRAREVLLENVEGETLSEPRLLRFVTGARKRLWNKNCVAVGLSAGFLEPLESTSIYLIQEAILTLIRFFPNQGINEADQAEFNRQMANRYEEARDFLILHYRATERDDTDFWRYCANMSIPEELEHRMELFRKRGYVSFRRFELFIEHSWLAVMIGQGIIPDAWDPRADAVNSEDVRGQLEALRRMISQTAEHMPSHEETLSEYCQADLVTGLS